MAAVTVNADAVQLDPSSGSLHNMPSRPASEAITAGSVAAIDTATGEVVLGQAISSPSYVKTVEGISLNGGQDGQPIKIAKSGIVTLSNAACMVAGVVYCLSPSSPGQLVPHADLTAGQLVQIVGYAINTTQLQVLIGNTGVARGS